MVNLLPKFAKHRKSLSIDLEEISFLRHWDAESETYAGGDSLATALYLGWALGDTVLLKEHWHSGKRCVRVYYFELTHDETSLIMPVVCNPFIEKLITTSELQVMPLINTFGIEVSPSEIPSRLQISQKKAFKGSSK
jgi:hypothetical protein